MQVNHLDGSARGPTIYKARAQSDSAPGSCTLLQMDDDFGDFAGATDNGDDDFGTFDAPPAPTAVAPLDESSTAIVDADDYSGFVVAAPVAPFVAPTATVDDAFADLVVTDEHIATDDDFDDFEVAPPPAPRPPSVQSEFHEFVSAPPVQPQNGTGIGAIDFDAVAASDQLELALSSKGSIFESGEIAVAPQPPADSLPTMLEMRANGINYPSDNEFGVFNAVPENGDSDEFDEFQDNIVAPASSTSCANQLERAPLRDVLDSSFAISQADSFAVKLSTEAPAVEPVAGFEEEVKEENGIADEDFGEFDTAISSLVDNNRAMLPAATEGVLLENDIAYATQSPVSPLLAPVNAEPSAAHSDDAPSSRNISGSGLTHGAADDSDDVIDAFEDFATVDNDNLPSTGFDVHVTMDAALQSDSNNVSPIAPSRMVQLEPQAESAPADAVLPSSSDTAQHGQDFHLDSCAGDHMPIELVTHIGDGLLNVNGITHSDGNVDVTTASAQMTNTNHANLEDSDDDDFGDFGVAGAATSTTDRAATSVAAVAAYDAAMRLVSDSSAVSPAELPIFPVATSELSTASSNNAVALGTAAGTTSQVDRASLHSNDDSDDFGDFGAAIMPSAPSVEYLDMSEWSASQPNDASSLQNNRGLSADQSSTLRQPQAAAVVVQAQERQPQPMFVPAAAISTNSLDSAAAVASSSMALSWPGDAAVFHLGYTIAGGDVGALSVLANVRARVAGGDDGNTGSVPGTRAIVACALMEKDGRHSDNSDVDLPLGEVQRIIARAISSVSTTALTSGASTSRVPAIRSPAWTPASLQSLASGWLPRPLAGGAIMYSKSQRRGRPAPVAPVTAPGRPSTTAPANEARSTAQQSSTVVQVQALQTTLVVPPTSSRELAVDEKPTRESVQHAIPIPTHSSPTAALGTPRAAPKTPAASRAQLAPSPLAAAVQAVGELTDDELSSLAASILGELSKRKSMQQIV